MIPPLYEHQKKIVLENRKWFGNWQGTGSAKTRSTLEIAEGMTLVICPKQQALDATWQRNRDKFALRHLNGMLVMSKETFRRDWESLPRFDTVIVDEAHTMLGVLPDTVQRDKKQIPKTSQLFESLNQYLKKHPPTRLHLCSATPASKPMHVWAIATLYGQNWNFFDFRERYYIQHKMGYRTIWIAKNTKALKDELANLVKDLGYTGRLQDFFDVPDQSHTTVFVDLTDEQKAQIRYIKSKNADPMSTRTKIRTIENGCLYGTEVEQVDEKTDRMVRGSKTFSSEKIDYILERAEEFPKMLIFANYTAQVYAIKEALEKEGYNVLTLTGETTDRSTVVERAEKAESCIVIAQSGISAGYELKSFACTIFASKSNKVVDYIQSLGRTLRADALKKNLFIHLIVRNGIDEHCHKSILDGEDFAELIQK